VDAPFRTYEVRHERREDSAIGADVEHDIPAAHEPCQQHLDAVRPSPKLENSVIDGRHALRDKSLAPQARHVQNPHRILMCGFFTVELIAMMGARC
jgi:hypothetical protein